MKIPAAPSTADGPGLRRGRPYSNASVFTALLLALAVHLGLFFASWDKPTVDELVGYSIIAHSVLETGQPHMRYAADDPPHYDVHPPTYPYLLALAFRVFGERPRTAAAAGLVCTLLTLVTMALVARRAYADWRPIAALAAAAYLVHPLALQGSLLTSIDTTLLPPALLGYAGLLVATLERPPGVRVVAVGLGLAVCLWIKVTTSLVLPVLTLGFLLTREPVTRALGTTLAATAVGGAAFLGSFQLLTMAVGQPVTALFAFIGARAAGDAPALRGRYLVDIAATVKTDALWLTPPLVALVGLALIARARARRAGPPAGDVLLILAGLVYLGYTVGLPSDGIPRYKVPLLAPLVLWTVGTLHGAATRPRLTARGAVALGAVALGVAAFHAAQPEVIATATVLSAQSGPAAKVRIALLYGLPTALLLAAALGHRRLRPWAPALLTAAFAAVVVTTGVRQARAEWPNSFYGIGQRGFRETIAFLRERAGPSEALFSYHDVGYYTGRRSYFDYVMRQGERWVDLERLDRLMAADGVAYWVIEDRAVRWDPRLRTRPDVVAFRNERFRPVARFGHFTIYENRVRRPGP